MQAEKDKDRTAKPTRRRIPAAVSGSLAALLTVFLIPVLLRGGGGTPDPVMTVDVTDAAASESTLSAAGEESDFPSREETEDAAGSAAEEMTGDAPADTAEEASSEDCTAEETDEEEPADATSSEEVMSGEGLTGEAPETESGGAESAAAPSSSASAPAANAAALPSASGTSPAVPSLPATASSAASSAAPSHAPPASAAAASSAPPASATAASSAPPASATAASSALSSSPAAPPHEHRYSKAVTKPATCGAAGVMRFRCACGASYTEAVPPTENHDWAPVTTVVHHEAQTHTVHHDEIRRWVTDTPAWDEYIYELHAICSGCGTDLTVLQHENGVTPAEHSWRHYETDGVGCGWHDEQVVVGTVHHEEVGHEEVTPAWDESVVDVPAWDETVITAYRCRVCGVVKD